MKYEKLIQQMQDYELVPADYFAIALLLIFVVIIVYTKRNGGIKGWD